MAVDDLHEAWEQLRKYINTNVIHLKNLPAAPSQPGGGVFQSRRGMSRTVLEVTSTELDELPMQDFLPVDYGLPSQSFGFEVGPLCLRWDTSGPYWWTHHVEGCGSGHARRRSPGPCTGHAHMGGRSWHYCSVSPNLAAREVVQDIVIGRLIH